MTFYGYFYYTSQIDCCGEQVYAITSIQYGCVYARLREPGAEKNLLAQYARWGDIFALNCDGELARYHPPVSLASLDNRRPTVSNPINIDWR